MFGCSTADLVRGHIGPSGLSDSTHERAIVGGNIHVGDPIIAIGGHFLHEGQRVQVTETRVARE